MTMRTQRRRSLKRSTPRAKAREKAKDTVPKPRQIVITVGSLAISQGNAAPQREEEKAKAKERIGSHRPNGINLILATLSQSSGAIGDQGTRKELGKVVRVKERARARAVWE